MSSAGNLWAQLVGQESVDEIANSLFTSTSVQPIKEEGLQERGAENYLSRLVGGGKKAKKRKISEATEGEKDDREEDQPETEAALTPRSRPWKEYQSDSEISSGGLSDESKEYVKKNTKKRKLGIKQRIAIHKKHVMAVLEANEGSVAKYRKVEVPVDKEVDGETASSSRTEVKQGTFDMIEEDKGSIPQVNSEPAEVSFKVGQVLAWKDNHLKRLNSRDDEGVVYYITDKLKEQKKYLIQNAVDILGREVAIRLFFKATKITYYGGLLIKKRNKARTPGGIFMYLMKNDKTISEEQKDALWKANTKAETEQREKRQKIKDEFERKRGAGGDIFKHSVLNRLKFGNRVAESERDFKLDDDDNYAMDIEPVVKPKKECGMPKRAIIDYSDIDEI